MNTAARLYDRDFLLAMASQTSFVVSTTLMAHYARWIEFLGGDVQQVGWIMGAGAVVGLLLRPWMGQWINRLGAHAMWLIGFGVFSVGSLGNLLLAELSLLIYSLRACLVLGAAIVFASSLTYITQTTPISRRTEAIGVLGAGGFIGMLLGPALGDLFLSMDRVRENFVILFVAAAIANAIPATLICFVSRPTQRSKSAVTLVDFFVTVRNYWPGTILLVDVAFGMCMTSPFVFMASYIDQLPLVIPGISAMGFFFWCYAGWALAVRITLRRMPERRGRRKVLLAGMLFMSAGMFCFWLVDAANPWMIVIPAVTCGTGHALMFHTMTALTIEPFPDEVRGTGSALALMMLDLGTIAGAPLLGGIADRWGFAWMFTAIGLFSLFAAAAYTLSSIPVWRARRGLPMPK